MLNFIFLSEICINDIPNFQGYLARKICDLRKDLQQCHRKLHIHQRSH